MWPIVTCSFRYSTMSLSNISWKESFPEDNTKKHKALGKGFDEILKTELNAIKHTKLGGSMKYTVINHDRAMQIIFDDEKRCNLYLIDTDAGKLVLYPVSELPMDSIDEYINSESEFLYKGEFGVKARIIMVLDNQQDTIYGTYDFNTPLEQRYVNELANRLRERTGVISTYVSQI